MVLLTSIHSTVGTIYLLTDYPIRNEKYQARSYIVRTELVTKHICRAMEHLCRATKNFELLNDVTCRRHDLDDIRHLNVGL